MHSHLAIRGKNGELALKPDTSLNVTEKNPMFNDVEMFSQPIELPYDKNRHIIRKKNQELLKHKNSTSSRFMQIIS